MHEIDYKIFGDDMQFIEIELDPMEAAVAEAGAMMYMDDGIEMETIFGDGSQQSSGFLGSLASNWADALLPGSGVKPSLRAARNELNQGIKTILNDIHERSPRSKVLLLGIFPRGEKPDGARTKNDEVNKLIAKFATFAETRRVAYLDIGAKFLAPDGILISPGPGRPEHAGVSNDVLTHHAGRLPIFGVCLGLQCMGQVFGSMLA